VDQAEFKQFRTQAAAIRQLLADATVRLLSLEDED
jgi:hypothetical protein